MKQTEIGLIPDDWEVKSLGEILTIKHGYGFEGDSFSAEDNGFIVVTPGNFKLNGGFQKPQASIFYIGKYPKEFNLKPNDLVIMMTDLSKESDTLGNPAIIPDDNYQYLHNQRIGLINCNSDNFDKNYLFHLLCSKDYHKAVVSTAAGSTVKHTSPKRIYTIKLPITQNLQEQQRIAKALSDVDALISTTEKLIQKKKNIKQGAMQELLTGKKRLPGFGPQTKSPTYKQTELGPIPDDWEVKSLGELCSLITKQTGFDYSATIKPSLALEHQKNTLPFIQNKDFEEERINFETDFYIPIAVAKKFPKIYLNEDVLLISISGRIGNVAYFKHTQDAFIGGAVGIAHFYDKDNINYCMRYLLSPNGQIQIFANEKSGAQHNLTIADVRKLSIPMPKDNKELTAIANVLSSMDKEIETLNTKLEKYRNLKTAMMQQLLTGKIRLR